MEDKELVRRILRDGEPRLYSELVSRHSPQVFSRVVALLKREELAAEVTQQTFIRAYEKLDTWRGAPFGAWVGAIAVRLSLNILLGEKRRRMVPIEKADGMEAEPYSDEHERMLQQMERAIAALPQPDRDIISLHYLQGMTANAVASHLGFAPGNVLVRLHRIRKRLKKELENGRDE